MIGTNVLVPSETILLRIILIITQYSLVCHLIITIVMYLKVRNIFKMKLWVKYLGFILSWKILFLSMKRQPAYNQNWSLNYAY